MKNKAIIGGLVAAGIIVLIAAVCVRFGGKIFDRPPEIAETNVNRPIDRPPGIPSQPRNETEAKAVYLAFGNPSNASLADPNNYLLVNNFYVTAYNRDKATANWAAWRVTKADKGDIDRVDSFRPDDRLPAGWTRVRPADYTNSGYDRGHLCPSADRNGSPDAMAATFLMTNMIPQTPDLNRGPWERLESYLRTLVTRGSDLYIVAGVYGDKGKIKNKITIPTNTWKIAVAIPAGADISAANADTRVIAVDMPNVKSIKNADWQTYRTTVSDIENKTGCGFFTNLPPNIRETLKNKLDNINN